MEKIIESFKNLYRGEGIAAKHWALVSLFILPALLSGVASLMDKDTPSQVMIIVGIAVLALLALSIVPMIWLLGYSIRFAILALPFLPLIGGGKDPSGIIIAILGFLVAMMVILALCVLVLPFYNYIIVEYVKYGNQGYLYNPLTLANYMKVAFKDTIIVFAKFWLVAIVASFPMGILNVIVFVVALPLLVLAAAGDASAAESSSMVYNSATVIIVVILGALLATLQMYVNTMIANAATENYIGVYKSKIEALENKEEFENI